MLNLKLVPRSASNFEIFFLLSASSLAGQTLPFFSCKQLWNGNLHVDWLLHKHIYIYTHTYVCVYMCTLVFYQIQDDYVRCVLSPNPVLVGEGNVLLYFFSVLASFCQLSLYLITLYALSLIISQSSCPLPQPTLCPLLCSMGPMLL